MSVKPAGELVPQGLDESSEKTDQTMKPNPTFYRKGKPLSGMERLEKYWAALFCCIPYAKYFTGTYGHSKAEKLMIYAWKDILNSKDQEDRVLSTSIRGVFNLSNVYDCALFHWTSYLDKSIDTSPDVIVAQIRTDCLNIGLLAALISTICFSALLLAFEGDFLIQAFMGKVYVISWAMACEFTLGSTLLSVFLVMGLDETSSQEETQYFINLFDKITFGVGTNSALLFFHLGCLSACVGLIAGALLYLSFSTAMICIGTFSFGALLQILVYMQLVASLHASRETAEFIKHNTKYVSLSVNDVLVLLKQCAFDFCCFCHVLHYPLTLVLLFETYLILYCSSNTTPYAMYSFIYSLVSTYWYIILADMQEQDICADDLGDIQPFLTYVDTVEYPPVQKRCGDLLKPGSKRRLVKVFELFQEANVLDPVDIDSFVPAL